MASSKYRPHDRTNFFKYMTADTARIVLTTRALRWSSPLLFNDPFDVPRELAFGVTPADLTREVVRRLTSLVQSPPKDTQGLAPQVKAIVEASRGLSAQGRTELVEIIREGSNDLTVNRLDDLREIWRRFVPDFRVLCLTEDPGSAPMWNHYAGAMSGVVLELLCREEHDSAWFAARKVTYNTPATNMFNAQELAEILLMPQRQAQEAILDWGTFRKSPDWSYEKEWRIVTSKRHLETGHHSDYPFYPDELSAIYFGPKTTTENKDALLAAARSLPHVRIIQVEIGMGQGFRFVDLR